MSRPHPIDPAAPMRGILDATGVTIADLARRRRVAPSTISGAIDTGERVQLSTLLEAARLCGGTLVLAFKPDE